MFAAANQRHFSLMIEGVSHDLQVLEFNGREAISQPFVFELELVSERPDLDLQGLLQQAAFLAFDQAGHGIHGQIYRVAQGESGKRLTRYHVTLRPQLAYLAHRTNQRIFQHLTVEKIISQVLEEHGIQANAYQFQLGSIYPEREYCVQYDESDLHFVQRMCEEEGIHYHFQHSTDGHVLVFGDDQTAFPKLAPTAYQQDSGLVADKPVIKRFGVRVETRSSRVTRRDYDFEKPKLLMEATAKSACKPDLEDYDYPGRFVDRERGKHLSQRILERHRHDFELAQGDGDQPRLVSGHFLALTEHPRASWNDLWLLTEIHHEGKQPQVLEESVTDFYLPSPIYGRGVGGEGWADADFHQGYRNHFTATPWAVPYRPPFNHPKPRILGSQSAVVTGPAGEEIHCDQYGRIKVQFFWDREGQADDKTSCWLRVRSSWAGDRYGGIAIPRVGMEVLVTFLEGDPDQPLVTGCLHHAAHVVPYALPANKTRSVFKTLSSPGGGGYNELRIEDKKGAEQIYLHAERDWDENIEHDQKTRIGNERHDTVEANSYSEFKAEEHRTTHLDRRVEVKANDHLTVGNNQHIKISTGQFINAGQEIHLSSGITLVGPIIKFNSGGAPGSGSGVSILGPALPGAAALALAGNLLQAPAGNVVPPEPEEAAVEEEEEEEELEEEVGITLRIGVFFDGTGNNLANSSTTEKCRRDDLQLLDERALQETIAYCAKHDYSDSGGSGIFNEVPDDSYGNAASNVAHLYDLYRDDSPKALAPDTKSVYLRAYLEGIGTTSGESDSLIGQGTGLGDTGVLARVEQSPEKILEQLRLLLNSNPELKVSNIEFDIFGFSRGAAAARHFANEVLKPNGGLLAKKLNPQTPSFTAGFDWAVNASINFIGLFDTVAAIVDMSRGDFSPANERNPGVNLYLPSGCARKVLQLAARDENRENFALNSVAPQHQEIRLPGVHSDLGGGYRPRMTEKLLISQPRSTLVTPARPLEHSSAWRETQMAIGQLEQRGLPGDGEIKPVHQYFATTGQHGNNSQSQRAIVVAAIKREVRGELSRVYLRIMRALAVKHEVPFKEIPDNTSFAIPSDLQAIAEKITAGAMGQGERLSTAQERHLHARYIHLSAHWTPSKGLLINKPAKQRQIYRNSPQGGYPE